MDLVELDTLPYDPVWPTIKCRIIIQRLRLQKTQASYLERAWGKPIPTLPDPETTTEWPPESSLGPWFKYVYKYLEETRSESDRDTRVYFMDRCVSECHTKAARAQRYRAQQNISGMVEQAQLYGAQRNELFKQEEDNSTTLFYRFISYTPVPLRLFKPKQYPDYDPATDNIRDVLAELMNAEPHPLSMFPSADVSGEYRIAEHPQQIMFDIYRSAYVLISKDHTPIPVVPNIDVYTPLFDD